MIPLSPPILVFLLAYPNASTIDMPEGLRPLVHQFRANRLLGHWREEVEKGGSLYVEFTFTGRSLSTEVKRQGILQMLKGTDKKFLGRLRLLSEDRATIMEEFLVVDDKLYWFDPPNKSVMILPFRSARREHFLTRVWLPLLVCLLPEAIGQHVDVGITKQDGWYTYLELAPTLGSWSRVGFSRARVVAMNRPATDLPANAPRQLHWWDGSSVNAQSVDIQKWRRNDPESVKAEDFAPPNPSK